MPRIERSSLMTLEAYARERAAFRARVMAHKQHRTVVLGEHVRLIFEDELTIRYQVQEMLRAERIFEEAGIQEELDAYNPLVPDGRNFKATLMLEYPDPEERRRQLAAANTCSARLAILQSPSRRFCEARLITPSSATVRCPTSSAPLSGRRSSQSGITATWRWNSM